MTIYFFENPKGKYMSSDGSRRFIRCTGRQAYEYIKQHHYENIRFFEYDDDNGNKIKIELPPETVKKYRKQERREQYVDDIAKDYGGEYVLSLDVTVPTADGDITLLDTIADDDTDVVRDVTHQMDIQALRKALHSLEPEEMDIINHVYFQMNTITEYAEQRGITQQAGSKRLKQVLKKLKNIF